MRGRKNKSKASSDEASLQEDSLHVADILETNKNGGTIGTRHEGGGTSTTSKAMHRLNRSMGDIAMKALDLGSLLAPQKELKRRTVGSASVASEPAVEDTPDVEEEEDELEDIFSMYSWTTSRQEHHKVQRERKLLNSSLRQGSFQKAFELYFGQSTKTT